MTVLADRTDSSQGPGQPDSGRSRARTKRTEESRFYLGLVGLVGLLVFGTLAIIALIPMVIPGYTSASITSGSMQPKLRPGDVVIAVNQGDAVIADGTIVVFEDPIRGDLVTHRIVGVNPDGNYVTKGDANGINDVATVPPENVKGVGRWVVPYVGLPRVWVADGQWLALALTLVAATAAIWFVRHAVETRYDPWRQDEPQEPDAGKP